MSACSGLHRPALFALTAVLVLHPIALQGAADASPAAEQLTPWQWTGVSQVLAVGDLHGSYDKSIRVLKGAGLVGEDLGWVGGERHLVVAGDFLDRGPSDRQMMDLLRRLQRESQSVGGRVHVLLGNHEVMNLVRDNRYINPISYRAFAREEQKADRRAAWRQFSNSSPGRLERVDPSVFQEQFPPGYFARQNSLEPEGEYGSWLLGLPAIVKINDVVYVHGGLTVTSAVLGVDGINRNLGEALRLHLEYRKILEEKGIITAVMTYGEIRAAARETMNRRRGISDEVREAAQGLLDTGDGPMLGSEGPLWYRGSSFEDERIEREMLERSLELLGAKAMVVAHSPTPGNRITSRFHGQLFRVDYGLAESETLQALVVERGEVLVLNASTRQTTKPVRELPTGSFRQREASEMSDPEMLKFLINAEVTDSRDLGRGRTRPRLLKLEANGVTQRGIFKTVEVGDDSVGGAPDRYEHEVAAYQLDRRIGLNMVPVTVIREIDGQRGSLQSWVEGAVDQEAASDYNLELYNTEAADRRLVQGEVFDALIGNHDRKPADILCLVNGDRLFLIDHSRAFSTSSELAWDEGKILAIDPRLSEALQALDRETLEKDLGDLISERQIEALLERRDKILARVVVATQDSDPEPRPGSGKGRGRSSG